MYLQLLLLTLVFCLQEVLASVQSLSSLASLSLTLSLECFWLGLSTLSRLQHLKVLIPHNSIQSNIRWGMLPTFIGSVWAGWLS